MKPSICIVAHFAYGALLGGRTGHVGGVERQTSLLARRLASRGYPTTLVTWDEGQEDGVVIDGVRVIKMCRKDAGAPGLRFLHPRWTSLERALARADADVYYQNCAEVVTGQVALFCRRKDRAFVYSVACDPDCDPKLPEMRTWRERALYRYGVAHADRIIVQTRAQQAMMHFGFGRPSQVLPMPCEGPGPADFTPPLPPAPGKARVLWVARIAPQKRLELLLDVAERMPDVTFAVAGPRDANSAYVDPLLERAKALPNVELLGRVERERMPELFRSVALLVSTSWTEGFPNTYLEAWSHGVPVVATVDPDGLIEERGLGATGREATGVAGALRSLLDSPERWARASEAARRYWLQFHTLDAAMPRFESALVQAWESRRAGAAARGGKRAQAQEVRT